MTRSLETRIARLEQRSVQTTREDDSLGEAIRQRCESLLGPGYVPPPKDAETDELVEDLLRKLKQRYLGD